MEYAEEDQCIICHGTGGGNNEPCDECGGLGYYEDEENQ